MAGRPVVQRCVGSGHLPVAEDLGEDRHAGGFGGGPGLPPSIEETALALEGLVDALAAAARLDRTALDALDPSLRATLLYEKAWCLRGLERRRLTEAELATLAFLHEWVDAGSSPMCGNSICQDRRFLAREMPELEAYFHYRNLDVSTLKILATQWAPAVASGFSKESAHLALSDIRDSIAELAWYRDNLLNAEVLEAAAADG